jgi:hypothetical protein
MKRKMAREIRVKVQDELYDKFSRKCEKEFKTVSIVVRELMAQYIGVKESELADGATVSDKNDSLFL